MNEFRFTAAPLAGGPPRTGRMRATTAAELRSSLLRVGLQVVDMKALPAQARVSRWREPLHRHLQSRRQPLKAELFDALVTMLDAGLPISEALSSIGGDGGSLDKLATDLRVRVSSGESIAQACAQHTSWFDPVEIEMLRAGEAAGTLSSILARLRDRQQRASALTSKLIAILTYPMIVLCVGAAVVVFLSNHTLPDLVTMLDDAGIEPPRLTLAIIALGQAALAHGPLLMVGLPLTAFVVRSAVVRSTRLSRWSTNLTQHATPNAVRRVRVASLFGVLAELLTVGIPLVEALRTSAATLGPGGSRLGQAVNTAADRVAAGEAFSDALHAGPDIDATTRRLLRIGETAGELPDVLASIAERDRRRAERAIDALARIAEPAVVLALSAVIGLVVMGAVLPLVRLQEIVQ